MKQVFITAGLVLAALVLCGCFLVLSDAKVVIKTMIETNDKIQAERTKEVGAYLAEINRLNTLIQEENSRRVQEAIDESEKLIKEIRERN
jgi:peptidoglycan hydrolase CwlO-like protein